MKEFSLSRNFLRENEAKNLSFQMFRAHELGESYVDEQCPKSDSFYNLSIFEGLKEKVRTFIEKNTNTNLASTFTYARIYRKGEILKKHVDREACEYSATITLDYSGEEPWNFFIKDNKQILLEINRGDILIYKGINLPHWRDELEDEWQTQVFLHYAPCKKEDIKDSEKLNKVFLDLYKKSEMKDQT